MCEWSKDYCGKRSLRRIIEALKSKEKWTMNQLQQELKEYYCPWAVERQIEILLKYSFVETDGLFIWY